MMFWKGHDLVIALILKIIKKYDHVKFEINEIRLQRCSRRQPNGYTIRGMSYMFLRL